MLNTEYVKKLIKEHQKKASDHIERLKAKTEKKRLGLVVGFMTKKLRDIGLIQMYYIYL